MTEQKVTIPEWPRVFLRQIFVFCFPFNFKTVVCVQQTQMFHSLIYPSIRPSARLPVHPFLAPDPFTSIEASSFFPSICPLNMRVIFPVMKVSLKNLIDYYTSTSVIMVKLKRHTSWIPRHRTSSLGPILFLANGFHFTIIQKLIWYTLTLIILNVTNFARCRRIPIRKVNITKFENATQDLKRGINLQ